MGTYCVLLMGTSNRAVMQFGNAKCWSNPVNKFRGRFSLNRKDPWVLAGRVSRLVYCHRYMEVYNQPKFDASLVAATCELWIAFIGKLDEYPDYLTKTIKHLIFFCWENRRQNQLTGPIHRQNPTIYRVTFYLHTVAGCFCISETWTLPDYHYILRYDCFRPPGIWCELDEFSPPWN